MTPTVAAHPAPIAGGSTGRILGWHVLAILVAFFGTVFAVNGVFLYLALSTHTGLVAVEPYVKGLHYNDRLAADEAQTKLGWSIAVAGLESGRAVAITVTDRAGDPVRGLRANASLGRPSTESSDRLLVLEETSPGAYTAIAGNLAAGAWILDVELSRQPGDDLYRLRRRLWLKP